MHIMFAENHLTQRGKKYRGSLRPTPVPKIEKLLMNTGHHRFRFENETFHSVHRPLRINDLLAVTATFPGVDYLNLS